MNATAGFVNQPSVENFKQKILILLKPKNHKTKSQMKKIILRTFLGFFILIFLVPTSCILHRKLSHTEFYQDLMRSKEEKYFYQKLKEFKDSKKDSILLKDLTNFEWDEVCVAQTYSATEENSYAEFYLKNRKKAEFVSDQKYFNEIVEGKKFISETMKGRVYFYFGDYRDSQENASKHKIIKSNCGGGGFDNSIKINIIEDKSYHKFYPESTFYGINFFY